MLTSFPYSGKPGVMQGTREFIPHPNYRLVYKIRDETISIMALVHTSRQWPPAVEGDG